MKPLKGVCSKKYLGEHSRTEKWIQVHCQGYSTILYKIIVGDNGCTSLFVFFDYFNYMIVLVTRLYSPIMERNVFSMTSQIIYSFFSVTTPFVLRHNFNIHKFSPTKFLYHTHRRAIYRIRGKRGTIPTLKWMWRGMGISFSSPRCRN